MANINSVLEDIEMLRDILSGLIESKGELLDSEVLEASILLDNALNEYNRLKLKGSCINKRIDPVQKYLQL